VLSPGYGLTRTIVTFGPSATPIPAYGVEVLLGSFLTLGAPSVPAAYPVTIGMAPEALIAWSRSAASSRHCSTDSPAAICRRMASR